MYTLKQEFHPGNEIRQILYSSRLKKVESDDGRNFHQPESNEPDASLGGLSEAEPSPGMDDFPTSGPLLDSSSKFGESSKRRTRRSFGLTLNGRRKVQRAVAVLDELYDPEQLLFLTGTVPGGGREVELAVAENAPFIVHRLKDWLNFYSGCPHEVWVWELQKRGMPHLHLVTAIADERRRQQVIERFHAEWCRILEEVCNRSGVDVFRQGFGARLRHAHRYVQAQAAVVKKSVARYMSKYLSKDSSQKRQCPILRWFGVSRPLNAEVKNRTYVSETVFASYKEAHREFGGLAEDIKGLSHLFFEYEHKVGFGRTLVAYPLSSVHYDLCLGEFSMSIQFDNLPPRIQAQFKNSTAVVEMFWFQGVLKQVASLHNLPKEVNLTIGRLPLHVSQVCTGKNQDFRQWRKRLLTVASAVGVNKVSNYLSATNFSRYCNILRALWNVEEELLDFRSKGFATVQVHSTAIERVRRDRPMPEGDAVLIREDLIEEISPVYEQLSFEIPFDRKPNGQFAP